MALYSILAMSSRLGPIKSWIKVSGISSPCRATGVSLLDRLWSLAIWKKIPSKSRQSGENATRTPSQWGVTDRSNREKAPQQTRDPLQRLCLLAGLEKAFLHSQKSWKRKRGPGVLVGDLDPFNPDINKNKDRWSSMIVYNTVTFAKHMLFT